MLDDKDIQKLIEVFPTKDEVVTKADFEDLRADFRELQNSVDAYASKVDTYSQEMIMLSHKVDRHDKWITQIAGKLGMKLEY